MHYLGTWRTVALLGGGASLVVAFGMIGACSGDTGGVDVDADASVSGDAGGGDANTGQDGSPGQDGGADGSADSGADAGCTVSADGGSIGCDPGYFCESPDCTRGTCVPREKPDASANLLDPICGCSGITYWNLHVARSAGESVRSKGRCKSSVRCGGPGPFKACPGDAKCNMAMDSGTGCGIQSQPGECWGMPEKCPPQLIGSGLRGCNEVTCRSACELIGDQAAYYPDNTCPL